jgi:hypothetical protein
MSHFDAGLLLREKSVHNPNTGQNWALSLLFSLVQELTPLWDASRDVFDGELDRDTHGCLRLTSARRRASGTDRRAL